MKQETKNKMMLYGACATVVTIGMAAIKLTATVVCKTVAVILDVEP